MFSNYLSLIEECITLQGQTELVNYSSTFFISWHCNFSYNYVGALLRYGIEKWFIFKIRFLDYIWGVSLIIIGFKKIRFTRNLEHYCSPFFMCLSCHIWLLLRHLVWDIYWRLKKFIAGGWGGQLFNYFSVNLKIKSI